MKELNSVEASMNVASRAHTTLPHSQHLSWDNDRMNNKFHMYLHHNIRVSSVESLRGGLWKNDTPTKFILSMCAYSWPRGRR